MSETLLDISSFYSDNLHIVLQFRYFNIWQIPVWTIFIYFEVPSTFNPVALLNCGYIWCFPWFLGGNKIMPCCIKIRRCCGCPSSRYNFIVAAQCRCCWCWISDICWSVFVLWQPEQSMVHWSVLLPRGEESWSQHRIDNWREVQRLQLDKCVWGVKVKVRVESVLLLCCGVVYGGVMMAPWDREKTTHKLCRSAALPSHPATTGGY